MTRLEQVEEYDKMTDQYRIIMEINLTPEWDIPYQADETGT